MKRTKHYSILITLAAASMLSACANYEVNTNRGAIPGYYIRYEMQEADRAVEEARRAGKDKLCPAEFKAAEAAKNNAYDVFRACNTEEGAALAKQATSKANALCPPQAQMVMPPPAPEPAPAPVVKKVPAPLPVSPAPTSKLTILPESIQKGQAAQLTWTSANATNCDIQPTIGQVEPQGALTITPADTMSYSLACKGDGGTSESMANIAVAAPAPVIATIQPKAAPVKQCSPTSIDIQFDTNKTDIKPQYHDGLKKLAEYFAEFPQSKVIIDGHTDNVGSKASNIKLSQQRADNVRSYLIKHFAIAPDRITAKGYGPDKPIADNGTKEGKGKNRRIDASLNCDN
jgi:OOP family OmpA-OmpF porin